MCGIVGYFGLSPRGINAIVAGMSSIKYRAPDSTGIGWFGDENEPIRVRRCIGPIDNLIGPLVQSSNSSSCFDLFRSLYAEPEDDGEAGPDFGQHRLLVREGFSADSIHVVSITYEELLQSGPDNPTPIVPGTAGLPGKHITFSAPTAEKLAEAVHTFENRYDLPPTVLFIMLKSALQKQVSDHSFSGFPEGESVDTISEELEHQMNVIQTGEGRGLDPTQSWENPAAYHTLWKTIRDITVDLPEYYDRDAVRAVFSLIDTSLLSHLPFKPYVREGVEELFRSAIPPQWELGRVNWLDCLKLEKELNVYGRAAAAAVKYLQEEEGFAESSSAEITGAFLQFFSSPVLAHGRWAIQSPVTVENAHPFFDAEKTRMLALNGQFNGRIETELKKYLEICGYTFRSSNSSEYVALLWGHYFDILTHDKAKMERTQSHVNAGLEKYAVGSQSIDYTIYNTIKGKTKRQIDETAFIQAARSICSLGGQIAVSGISVHSPRSMYVASHNRPVYITRPKQGDDVMVVSDLNAALGLFTQETIQRTRKLVNHITQLYRKKIREHASKKGSKKELRKISQEFQREKMKLLDCFTIRVLPLEGEELFARITNTVVNGSVSKEIIITNFAGELVSDIEEFETILDPTEEKSKVYSSFYETHLQEVPDRLRDMIQTYLPEDERTPLLAFRDKFIFRHFGTKLERCSRLVLMGMGSSYHVGLMTKQLLYHLIPEKTIITYRPIDIIAIEKHINPETDLVIMLSWSGTTADMVETAKQLVRAKVTIIAVTNKPFSDLGLAAWRSGGIINVYTGEELTSSAVKSPLSMMYAILLFGLWHARRAGKKRTADKYFKLIESIPATIEGILNNFTNTDLSFSFPYAPGICSRLIVIDDLTIRNTGYEAALKLEENSGHLVGKTIDYTQLYCLDADYFTQAHYIIVGATCSERIDEAIDCMKFLYLLDVPFTSFTVKQKRIDEISYFSNNRMLLVPSLERPLQPFADLILYYIYTYRYALASGSVVPGFPRNRAKSVTTSRSRTVRFTTPQAELAAIGRFAEELYTGSPAPSEKKTYWEHHAELQWEKNVYSSVDAIADILAQESPFEAFVDSDLFDAEKAAAVIIEHLEEEGELIIFPLDKQARAAAEDFITVWRYLVKGQMRIEDRLESIQQIDRDSPILIVASRMPLYGLLSRLSSLLSHSAVWIGPPLGPHKQGLFSDLLGFLTVKNDFSCAAHLSLYAVLTSVFLHLLDRVKPKQAAPVKALVKNVGRSLIRLFLDSEPLFTEVRRTALNTAAYETAHCISPFSGTAAEWEQKTEYGGTLHLAGHSYGESGHGPLATIDSDVKNKFVLVEDREKMIDLYGEARVLRWEQTYNRGNRFTSSGCSPELTLSENRRHPFFAEGYWFLPELKPDYTYSLDNLIILDAASNRYTDQALDEFGSFKARYAKMVIITQYYFLRQTDNKALYDYPGADVIHLPSLKDKQGSELPIPDLYLPFVHTLIATRFAAAVSHRQEAARLPEQNIDTVFNRAFGVFGETMRSLDIGLRGLTRATIAALKSLSPFIHTVAGAGRYDVVRIKKEEQLFELTGSGDQIRTAKLVDHFRLLKEQKKPFFMLKPVKESFSGIAVEASEELFEGNWDQWFEGFGTSWQTLAFGNVGIIESRTGIPLLELPAEGLQEGRRNGRLYHFYVYYQEWDYTQSLEEQIMPTLDAMQKGFLTQKLESSGYITLVNCFNELMLHYHIVWEDWLIGFVVRELLFRKDNRELGALIAHRTKQVLEKRFIHIEQGRLVDLKKEFISAWPVLEKYTPKNDEARWDLILSLFTEQHR
jgi:glucosamine 6-phosphate synthetase-like amidotransferase/phosphosugar isomerase protein